MSKAPSKATGGDAGREEAGEREPLLARSAPFPAAPFATAHKSGMQRHIPQAIGHRGYKAKFPENTMAAFRGAVQAGVHAIETDVHLTKDGVAVLSHDEDLKRCFGKPDKLIENDWDHISTFRTTKEPHEPMPRLQDLLEYVAEPSNSHLWVLLDIKLDDDPDELMRAIGDTIKKVPPFAGEPWNERLVLGVWAAKYVPLCYKYCPGLPISHIGFSLSYAEQFLAVPNVSFNMLQGALMGSYGASFLRKAKALNRPVFAWTVNEVKQMRWCIAEELDGVISDDPRIYLDTCKQWQRQEEVPTYSFMEKFGTFRLRCMLVLFSWMFRWKYGGTMDKRFIQKL